MLRSCKNLAKRMYAGAGEFVYRVKISFRGAVPAAEPDADPEKTVWMFLLEKTGNAYAAAGLMGNFYAESGLRANVLQNSFKNSQGMTDESYTIAVDSLTYKNFVKDNAGYGLAQWTFRSRKQKLLNYARKQGKSIGDLHMQLDFFWKELTDDYPDVLISLQRAKSVREASDEVLMRYEMPEDKSETMKQRRAGYGQGYYDKYTI